MVMNRPNLRVIRPAWLESRGKIALIALMGLALLALDHSFLSKSITSRELKEEKPNDVPAPLVPDSLKAIGFKGLYTPFDKVPRILHFMLLGPVDRDGFMWKTYEWQKEYYEPKGIEVKMWLDEDADALVEGFEHEGLTKAWAYMKADNRMGCGAKRADFIRPLIVYAQGGAYLDVDMLGCKNDGIDYMFDTPGVASFPWKLIEGGNQLNGAAMSAPVGHPLMGYAIQSFIDKGELLQIEGNMMAAGPIAFANITDYYLREKIGVDIPPMFEGYNPYDLHDSMDGMIKTQTRGPAKGSGWMVQIGDIRIAFYGNSKLYHIGFKSWKVEDPDHCEMRGEWVKPWIDGYCRSKTPSRPFACDPKLDRTINLRKWKAPSEIKSSVE